MPSAARSAEGYASFSISPRPIRVTPLASASNSESDIRINHGDRLTVRQLAMRPLDRQVRLAACQDHLTGDQPSGSLINSHPEGLLRRTLPGFHQPRSSCLYWQQTRLVHAGHVPSPAYTDPADRLPARLWTSGKMPARTTLDLYKEQKQLPAV